MWNLKKATCVERNRQTQAGSQGSGWGSRGDAGQSTADLQLENA